MSTPTHTPGPWQIQPSRWPYHGGIEVCAGDSTVAVMYREVGYDDWQDVEPLPQAEANAAFIVSACNAHEELVEALRIARQNLVDGSPAVLSVIDAAIAKAEGRA